MSKIQDVRTYIRTHNTQLIPADIVLDCMPEYNQYHDVYDVKLHDYAKLRLDEDYDVFDADAFADVQSKIRMLLMMNREKYDRLYEVLSFDYNPLYNTEWTETQTFGKRVNTDKNGERNTENIYGERGSESKSTYGEQLQTNTNGKREQTSAHGATQSTDTIAQRTNQDTMSQQKTTDVIASRTNSDSMGTQTHTDAAAIDKSTHKSNGYDSSTGVPDGEDETNIGQRQRTDSEYTDTHTIGGGTDTHTTDAYTDTHTIGGGTDTHATEAYTDKVTDEAVTDTVKNEQHEDTVTNTANAYTDSVKQHESTDTHTEDEYANTIERHGNIGVTTSTQLADDHVRFWTDFKFWDKLYSDIIDEITLFIY